mgnify:CR=1 FL=1
MSADTMFMVSIHTEPGDTQRFVLFRNKKDACAYCDILPDNDTLKWKVYQMAVFESLDGVAPWYDVITTKDALMLLTTTTKPLNGKYMA